MKRALLTTILVFGSFVLIKSNPMTPTDFVYVSAFPPEIGIVFRDSINLAGDYIYTTSGSAVIYSYDIPIPEDTVIFDSSNTSGFTIDPEADTIRISSLWYLGTVRLGTFWWPPAPIKGHPIHLVWVNPFRDETRVELHRALQSKQQCHRYRRLVDYLRYRLHNSTE